MAGLSGAQIDQLYEQRQQQTQAQQTGAGRPAPVPTYRDTAAVGAGATAAGKRDSSAWGSAAWDRYVQMAREHHANPNPYAGQVVRPADNLQELFRAAQKGTGVDGSVGRQAQWDRYNLAAREYMNNPAPQMPQGWEGSAGRQALHDRAMTDTTNPDNYEPLSLDRYIALLDRSMGLNQKQMESGLVYAPATTVESFGGPVTLPQKYYYTGDDPALMEYARRLNELGLTAGNSAVDAWQSESGSRITQLQEQIKAAEERRDELKENQLYAPGQAEAEEYAATVAEIERLNGELADAKTQSGYAMSFGTPEQRQWQEEFNAWLGDRTPQSPTATAPLSGEPGYWESVYDAAAATAETEQSKLDKLEEQLAAIEEQGRMLVSSHADNVVTFGATEESEREYQARLDELTRAGEELREQIEDAAGKLTRAKKELGFAETVRYQDIREREDFEELAARGEYRRTHREDWARKDYEEAAAARKRAQSRAEGIQYAIANGTASAEDIEWLHGYEENRQQLNEKVETTRAALEEITGKSEGRGFFGAIGDAAQNFWDSVTGREQERIRSYNEERITEAWTEDEVKTYDALNEAGMTDKAREYAISVNTRHKAQEKAKKQQTAIEKGKDAGLLGAVAGTIGQVVTSPLALAQWYDQMADIAYTGRTTGRDYLLPNEWTTAFTTGVAQKLNEVSGTLPESWAVVGGKGLGDLYQTGISSLQSLGLGLTLGEAGTLMVFAGIGGASAFEEAMQRGASEGQAVAYSALSGAIEVLTEKVGLENLLSGQVSGSVALDILKQSGIEGSEELSAAVLDNLIDRVILRDKSAQAVRAYELQLDGVSYADAQQQARREAVNDALWETVAGAISGGMGAATNAAGNAAAQKAQQRREQKQLRDFNADMKTLDKADTVINKAQEIVDNAGEHTAEEVSAAAEKIRAATEEADAVIEKYGGTPPSASTTGAMTAAEMRVIGRRNAAASAALTEKIKERDAAAARAEELARQVEEMRAKGQENAEASAALTARIREKEAAAARAEELARQVEEAREIGRKNAEASAALTGRIKAWAVSKDGELVASVEKEDGTKEIVKADEIEADEGTAYLIGEAQQHQAYGAEMLNRYTAGQKPGLYAGAFEAVADVYGTATTKTKDEAHALDQKSGGRLSSVLTQEQFDTAFDKGREAKNNGQLTMDNGQLSETEEGERIATPVTRSPVRNDSTETERRTTGEERAEERMSGWTPKKGGKPKKPGTVRFADAEADGRKYKAAAPEKVSDATLYVAEKLANLTGFNFVFYQTEADSAGRYKGANGFYRNGTVYLDANAGANKTTEQSAVLLTAAHEMTHAIRENFEEGYNALRDFVTDHLLEEGENLIQLARDKIRRSAKPAEMTLADAVEEVVADACEEMLSNTKYAELMAQEHPTLAQSIKSWITDFVDKIKTAVSQDARRHREAEVMRKFAAELQEIWDKALVGATSTSESGELRVESEELSEGEGERIATTSVSTGLAMTGKDEAESGTKYAWERLSDEAQSFRNDIDEWENNERPNGETFILGSTGSVFQGLGAIESDVYMLSDKINSIYEDHKEITDKEIKNIPEIIENPVLVLKSRNTQNVANNTRLAVFGMPKAQNGAPIMAVFDLRPVENKIALFDMQKVTSAYTKNNSANSMRNFIQNSDVLYADKEKAASLLQAAGFQNAYRVEQSDYIGSITYENRKVNINGKRFEEVFSTDNNVAKGKNSERDSEGTELSEGQAAYFAESKVRDEDGNLKVMYHGTNNEFTVFHGEGNESFNSRSVANWFTDSEKTAKTYAPYGKIMRLYLDIKKPLIIDAKGQWHYNVTYRGNKGTQKIAEMAKRRGYDGVIFKNIRDYSAWYSSYGTATVVATFESRQSKNVNNLNPTTNADIRYSERDITEGDTAEETAGREKSYAQLRAEIRRLQGQVEYWKGQTKITKEASINEKDVAKLARRLVRDFETTADVESIRQQLTDLGNYLVRGDEYGETNFTDLYEQCRKIAAEILTQVDTVIDDSNHDERTRLTDYLKAHAMDVTTYLKAGEVTREWLKAHKEIKTRAGGTSVDSVYAELSEMFGEGSFPPDVPDGDQLDRIATVLDMWEDVRGNPYELYMGETITELANEIMDTMLSDEVRQTAPTRADKAQHVKEELRAAQARVVELEDQLAAAERNNSKETEKLRKTVEKERAKLIKLEEENEKSTAELRQRYEERAKRKEEVYREGTARLKEKIAEERAAKWAKVEEVKRHYQKMMEDARKQRKESAAEAALTDRINKKANRLRRMLVTNTDRQHIPDVLKNTVGRFLNLVDLSSESRILNGKDTESDLSLFASLSEMNDLLRRQQKYMEGESEDGDDLWLDISDEVRQNVQALAVKARGYETRGKRFTVSLMTAADLRALDDLLSNLTKAISDYDTALGDKHKRRMSELGRATIFPLSRMGEDSERSSAGSKLHNALFVENTTPIYFFDRLGEGGKIIFQGLQSGWDRLAFNARKIIAFTDGLYTAKEARAWQREIQTVKLSDGSEMRITTAQLMSLYCLYKREQARKHLNVGGLRIGNIDAGGRRISQTKHFKLSMEEAAEVLTRLTDRQREVADALQGFMNGQCSDWGNEVSMERYGYRAFLEENYFPIKTDDNDRPAVDPERRSNDMYRLLNISATKALNLRANNALVVGDIFRVFSEHSADMAKYNALALPLVDLMKWYNYKEKYYDSDGLLYTETVQKSIERAYGKVAKSYMVQFVKDLNGVNEGGTSTADTMTKRILSRYKAASVGFNMRVAIQQPTAYVRAAMAIEPKYLVKGLKPTKGSVKEMLEYSGIAAWKNLGFVQTDIGRGMRDQIMHTETLTDDVQNRAMWLAEWADKVTWARLWEASKAKAKEELKIENSELRMENDGGGKPPALREEEALMERTAEIFRDVVYHTQVVDATMTRSQNMRNPGLLQNMTTAYMAEPTLSYNIVLNAFAEWRAAQRAGANLKEPAMKLAKSMGVYAAATAATLLAASFWDVFRDDDDYESFWQKFNEALWGGKQDKWYQSNVMQELLLWNKIPVVKDIWAVAMGDSVDRMDMQAFTSLKKAVEIDLDALQIALGKDPNESAYEGMTIYGKLMNNLRALSQVSGIAFYNLTRDVIAMYNTALSGIVGEKVTSYKPSDKASIRKAYQAGFLSEEEAIRELKARGVSDNDNAAFWTVEGWKDGTTQDSLMDALYAAVKTGNDAEYKRLMSYLDTHGVTTSTVQGNIRGEIKDWYLGTDTERASIGKQTAYELLRRYGGKTEGDADELVEQWTCRKVTGIDYSDIGESYIHGDITESKAYELQLTYGYGTVSKRTDDEKKDAEEDTKTKLGGWKMEKETGVKPGSSFNGIRDEYNAGRIGKQKVIEWRMKYAGDTKDEAENTAYRYEWIAGVPELKAVTGNQARLYDEYLTGSGIGKTVYYNAVDGHAPDSFHADLVEGSTTKYVPNSKRDKVWAYIDSLDLTPAQKDAMARVYADMNGNPPTKSWLTTGEAPWNRK